jgi:hypothetical protein
MKRNYFTLVVLIALCCLSSTIYAATITVDSLRFKPVFDSLKTVGGGTISLSMDMPIRIAKSTTYTLESDASNPININTNQFKIISIGDGTSADSCFLKIGNNVNITGSNLVITGFKRGHIRIAGGSVNCITTTTGASAISNNDGWIFMSGGTVSVNATGLVAGNTASAIYDYNYMSLIVTGGTISATGDYTKGIVVADLGNGIVKPLSGATINASGTKAYAIQQLGGGSPLIIGNNLTITTTSTDGTDAALVNGGATATMLIPSNVTNLNITSTTPYKLDNSAAVLIDFRNVTLTPNPANNTAFVNPTNVALTAAGNTTMAFGSTKIYYSYGVTPTATSPSIANGGNILASSSTTTIIASIGAPVATYNTTIYTFTYTVQNATGAKMIATFADLQAAYTASQTGAAGTTQMQFLANITTSGAYSFVPDAAHPITIDANGYSFITGSSGTLGGSLLITSSTTTGIIKIAGAYTTNISGGTYTVNGNAPVIYANSGSGVTDAATKLILSNSTFTVNGTSNAAGIVKFATSNGNLLSATGCTFNTSAKGITFNCVGPQNITISGCTLNVAGSDASSIAISQSPTSQASNYLTIDGLALTMNAGTVVYWNASANKNITAIIKDMTVTGTPNILTNTVGTLGTRKFYDFRAFTPTATPVAGNYNAVQNVTLSLNPTAVLPVDAAGATIVYTTDGTEPATSSAVYSLPIPINSATVIKAAAIKDGFMGKSVSFNYSFTTATANLSADNLEVYPTVVESILTLSQPVSQVQVLNLVGKKIMGKTNVNSLDLSDLKSGIYILNAEVSNNIFKTFKVIKK